MGCPSKSPPFMIMRAQRDYHFVMITFITFMSDLTESLTTQLSKVFLRVHRRPDVFLRNH